MPTYSYLCQTCGVQFDRFQKFEEKPLTRCPECRKGKVRRVVQPSAIVFKGSGWYKTDHRSSSASSASSTKSESKDAKAEKSEKAASDAPASNDAKPAAAESAPAKSKD